jgi:hypothetical protein
VKSLACRRLRKEITDAVKSDFTKPITYHTSVSELVQRGEGREMGLKEARTLQVENTSSNCSNWSKLCLAKPMIPSSLEISPV